MCYQYIYGEFVHFRGSNSAIFSLLPVLVGVDL